MAKSKKTSPIVNTLQKFFNHYIVRNVLILLLIGFFLCYGSLVFLRHYTHHGEALSVPDVRGLTLAEAQKVLQAQKMRCQLSDSVYVTSVKPGAVYIQNPEPSFKVKEKRNIFLTINAMAPEKVKMPDVVGVTLRQAKTILESQGLNIGVLKPVPDIAKNNVLKQLYKGKEIRKGTSILKGAEIDLVVGAGLSDERTSVPNLVGLTLTEARNEATKYSLNISVIYDNSVTTSVDSIKAFIFQQRPLSTANAMLQLGSAIDVWMTVDEGKKPGAAEEGK